LKHIPVIMITMVESRSMGHALGAADYLSKPVEQARLYEVVSRWVRKHPPAAAGGKVEKPRD
jgi:DNA-binding response OmpR family regulator